MAEIMFDNPGHRDALKKLGVLDKDQSKTKVEDFVKRVLETNSTEPAIYILRQELATYHQGLLFLDFGIEMTKKQAEKIQDQEMFEKVTVRVSNIENVLYKARIQREVLMECANGILKKSPTTETTTEHYEVMQNMDKEMKQIIKEKGDAYLDDLATLKINLNQWSSE